MSPSEPCDGVAVHHGDALAVLRSLPDASVHAIITDPPYGLADHKASVVADALTAWASGDRERVPTGKGFMGREWDSFVPPPAVWDECLRVLKPGGHLAVFAGSRTVDLMGLSIRLAGFEMRDGIAAWLYSSGMPKGGDVGKAIDKAAGATDAAREWTGWASQLKPAHEPILLARKPFRDALVRNIVEHRAGALNIDACRVGEGGQLRWATPRGMGSPDSFADDAWTQAQGRPYAPATESTVGRWPTNVVLAHHPDCGPDEAPGPCVPGCQVAALDEQEGGKSVNAPARWVGGTTRGEADIFGANLGTKQAGTIRSGFGDSGGASRFFPTFRYQAKAPRSERPMVDGKGHPTVKPLKLLEWLVDLLVPEDGCVLDPFAGSGTTLQAARSRGKRAVGIERDEHSVALIHQRLTASVSEAAPVADELVLFEAG